VSAIVPKAPSRAIGSLPFSISISHTSLQSANSILPAWLKTAKQMQDTLSDAARAVWNRNHGVLAEFALNLALSQLRYDSYFASVRFPSISA
jgi:hypothetical protein